MRIRCAYSGLDIQIQHFPASLTHGETVHPIFFIPQKKLFQFIRKWGNAELTTHDSYLLFLALLNSTDKVDFRIPASYLGSATDSIVANNMEQLVRAISYANTIVHPAFDLPGIAITPETCNLTNAREWIKDWIACYHSFQSGEIAERESQIILRRESLLQTFIKDVNKPISHYAKIIADWAADAADFPLFPVVIEGRATSCREYWKTIIIKCCKSESIFSILTNDLDELISHCEENIDHGSIYAHTLMQLLRAGKQRQFNYLGLGDVDLSNSFTPYRILEDDTSVEMAAKLAMIDSAPAEKPIEGNYPSRIAFLRAKIKWEMKCDYQAQMETAAAITANTATVVTDDGKEL